MTEKKKGMTLAEFVALAKVTDYVKYDQVVKRITEQRAKTILMVASIVEQANYIDNMVQLNFLFGDEIDQEALKERMGKLLWYLVILCDKLGLSLEKLAKYKSRININNVNPALQSTSTFRLLIAKAMLSFAIESQSVVISKTYFKPNRSYGKLMVNLGKIINCLNSLMKRYNIKFSDVLESYIERQKKRFPRKFMEYFEKLAQEK